MSWWRPSDTFWQNCKNIFQNHTEFYLKKYSQFDIATATLHIKLGEQQLQKKEMKYLSQETAGSLQLMKNCALIEEEIERSNRNFKKYRLKFTAKMLSNCKSLTATMLKRKYNSHMLKENAQLRHLKSNLPQWKTNVTLVTLKFKKLKPNIADLQLLQNGISQKVSWLVRFHPTNSHVNKL